MTPDPERWARVERLFDALADAAPEAQAAALAAEPDRAVADEVAALLAAETRAAPFFDAFAAGLDRDALAGDALAPGGIIGAYRVEGFVGEGGMGTVYRAVRADGAFERTVALKVLRVGTGDVRRFLAERALLARLDHPGIARLYDGGLLPDGRPYFAMEWIDGEPITTYAARHDLGVDARLALFRQVCDAVQFAHAQLVVHRDLKPSNVLVCDTDDGPRAKLLDFGIARDLGGDALTEAGDAAPLTPAYAAPEQVRGEAVSTATDVYALGVLLYELLTGRRPYRLESRARAAVERAILDTEPTRPSAAVTLPPDAPSTAPPTEPAAATRLARRLSGDLDGIVLKALAKEPARRYASADAFARDVGRHLDGLPVEARPASAAYRAGRFVRRHRAGVAVAVAAVLLLAGWGATATISGRRLAAERDRATAQAGRAERVASILFDLFEGSAPSVARGDTLTARALLDAAATRLGRRLGEAPETDADVALVLARVYRELALYDSAAAWAARAARLYERAEVPAGPRAALALAEQGRTLVYARADSAAVDAVLTDAVRRARASGVDSALVIALATRGLARFYWTDPAPAQRDFESAVAVGQRSASVRPALLVDPFQSLGGIHSAAGRSREARDALRQSLRLARAAHAGPHPDVAYALLALARELPPAEAEPLAREAVAVARAAPRGTEPVEGRMLGFHADLLARLGRPADAYRLRRDALATYRRDFGPDHPLTATALLEFADAASGVGRHAEAVQAAQQGIDLQRQTYGADDRAVKSATAALVEVLLRAGRFAEAEPVAADLARRWPESPAWRQYATAQHARALLGLGRTAEARRRIEPLLTTVDPFAEAQRNRAAVALYDALGQPARAAPFRDALAEAD